MSKQILRNEPVVAGEGGGDSFVTAFLNDLFTYCIFLIFHIIFLVKETVINSIEPLGHD
jgi:hypothetical protein